MRTYPYSAKEIKIIYDCIEKKGIYNGVYKDISNALAKKKFVRTPEAIRSFLSRNHKVNRNNLKKGEEYQRPTNALIENNISDHITKIRSLRDTGLKVITEKFIHCGNPVKKADIKIVSTGDWHIPFENYKVLKHMIKYHSDADILVVNGDIFEHYLVSQWKKDKSIPLRLEYEIALEWIMKLHKIFKKIVLVYGNHEYRLRSYISSNLDPAVHFATSPDLLKRLADGYDFDEYGDFVKVHDFDNVFYEPGLLNWYTKIGQCLFVHPRSYVKQLLGTAEQAMEHFIKRGEDFQCLVLAHTHRQSSSIVNGKLLLESGCACVPLDYLSDGKLNSLNQTFGYSVIYLDELGNVDFNTSHNFYWGTGHPVKTSDPLELLK